MGMCVFEGSHFVGLVFGENGRDSSLHSAEHSFRAQLCLFLFCGRGNQGKPKGRPPCLEESMGPDKPRDPQFPAESAPGAPASRSYGAAPRWIRRRPRRCCGPGAWGPSCRPEQKLQTIGVLFRLVWLKMDGFHWFRWFLFHLPGPSIFPKGHLCSKPAPFGGVLKMSFDDWFPVNLEDNLEDVRFKGPAQCKHPRRGP